MRRARRRLRRLRSGEIAEEEEDEEEDEEEEEQPRFREYPTFSAMIDTPSVLPKPSFEPPPLPKSRTEKEITDARGLKRKRMKSPPPTPLRKTVKEMLPPMMKKRIGENKTLLPLPPKSNLPLKLKMKAAQKIKKKYINMSYPKLSLRKKKEKK